jgi:hypothetical protein
MPKIVHYPAYVVRLPVRAVSGEPSGMPSGIVRLSRKALQWEIP